jgi:hypothetical protein
MGNDNSAAVRGLDFTAMDRELSWVPLVAGVGVKVNRVEPAPKGACIRVVA